MQVQKGWVQEEFPYFFLSISFFQKCWAHWAIWTVLLFATHNYYIHTVFSKTSPGAIHLAQKFYYFPLLLFISAPSFYKSINPFSWPINFSICHSRFSSTPFFWKSSAHSGVPTFLLPIIYIYNHQHFFEF